MKPHTAQKRLHELLSKRGRGRCWVCGSAHGLKMARNAYGLRCRKCLDHGRTCPDFDEYTRLRQLLDQRGQ